MGIIVFLIILGALICTICYIKIDNIFDIIEYIKSRSIKKLTVVNHDIQIDDLFVNNDVLIQPDNPFTDNNIEDHCDEIFIIKDLKTNHRGELWVQYISVKNITRGFDWTREMSADDFLYLNQKRNDLKELFNL